MRKLLLLATFAVALLLMTGPAAAKLPRPDSFAIAPVASLGGVDFGMTLKQADKAWGKRGECTKRKKCRYVSAMPTRGTAQINARKGGTVHTVSIISGFDRDGEIVTGGPLEKFGTEAGIGLGDKGKLIGKEFPEAKLKGHGFLWKIRGPGKSYIGFFMVDQKTISLITMSDGMHQGSRRALRPAAANAPGGVTAPRSSSDAVHGHYTGRDVHDNHIRFNYVHGEMRHFRINHEGDGTAHVRHGGGLFGWSQHCNEESHEFCSHGHWTSTHQVKGGWTQGDNRHSTHFTAHWSGEIEHDG